MNRRVLVAAAICVLAGVVIWGLSLTAAAQAMRKIGSRGAAGRIESSLLQQGDIGTVAVTTGGIEFDMVVNTAQEPGAVVVGVAADGPAGKAGIVRGDVIMAAGDADVNDAHDLAVAMEPLEPGDVLTLRLRHGDEERSKAVTLGDRDGLPELGLLVHPGADGGCGLAALAGPGALAVDRLPFDLALPRIAALDLPQGVTKAAYIGTVVDAGPAAKAGLEDGDLVTAVGSTPIENAEDLVEALANHQPGDTVSLTIARPGEDSLRKVTVTLGAKPDDTDKAYLGVRGLGFFSTTGDGPAAMLRRVLRLRSWPSSSSKESDGTGAQATPGDESE